MEANSTTTDHETLPMLPSRSPGRRYPGKTVVVAAICAFALGAIGASILPAPQKATTSLTSLTTADKPSSQQTQELVLKNALDCSATVNTCAETDGGSAGSCLKDFGVCLHQNDAKGDSPVFHGDGDHPAFGEKGLKGCICEWYRLVVLALLLAVLRSEGMVLGSRRAVHGVRPGATDATRLRKIPFRSPLMSLGLFP